MKDGDWLPISNALLKYLPKSRKYTELEAGVSIQSDYDRGNPVTVSGYAALWMWSRKKVRKFLCDFNVEIVYPDDTKIKRNQRGHIRIHKRDIKGTDKGHIRCINSKQLEEESDIKGTDKGHKRDIKGNTTKNLNPKPEPNPKRYTDEIKNFTNSYQKYISNQFPKTAPEITDSLIESCCDTIDKLIRLDDFTFDEIYKSVQWAARDDFWSDQILSLSQLRKKAKNGNKKFVNLYTAYQKKDTQPLNMADQRTQTNAEAVRRFVNE